MIPDSLTKFPVGGSFTPQIVDVCNNNQISRWKAVKISLMCVMLATFDGRSAPGLQRSIQLIFSKSQFPTTLAVQVLNESPLVVKSPIVNVWKTSNSWGWHTFKVDLKDLRSQRVFAIERKNIAFTRNGPGFVSIPAGGSYGLEINLADGWWKIPSDVDLTNGLYQVRVRLEIPVSPEAMRYNVFVGDVVSDWK